MNCTKHHSAEWYRTQSTGDAVNNSTNNDCIYLQSEFGLARAFFPVTNNITHRTEHDMSMRTTISPVVGVLATGESNFAGRIMHPKKSSPWVRRTHKNWAVKYKSNSFTVWHLSKRYFKVSSSKPEVVYFIKQKLCLYVFRSRIRLPGKSVG